MDNQEKLKKLVKQFSENIEDYKSTKYDESNTRTDFIDKFFECLGWDVRNDQGHAESYREVVREDTIHVAGKPKAPDYSFRIGGNRKFFVEAKKPSVDIKMDMAASYQLRRYAYTSKLPLSILTDFEEFAVYDTRIKPKPTDKASTARIFYCSYEDYEKHWDFIETTFSKDAILKGSFDKYIKDPKRKKGTSEVDKEFLKQIDSWRIELAKNIALRNKELSIYDLNFAVQKIIDRIIFLRIAEDRGMEDYGTLQKMTENKDKKYHIYQELIKYFKRADDKYNSGLFDFKEDKITQKLTIDHKIFNEIIKDLYYPHSPYEFSVLPIEILGNIYEQFLGKTIRLTPGHLAKVEEKPEVRKAGGVYYTPQYIVDYIVKNTLGEKLKDRTPKQIEELTVLDPACGSGSFLITAYDYLLNHYLDYYTQDKQKDNALKKGLIHEVGENDFRLTIDAKRDILTGHIYGVDIDSQAVEVTKLSLLLKLMEDEQLETTQHLFTRRELKLLPDLSGNIKCGNSLIGSDFYEGQQIDLFDDEMIRKINAFDWDKQFPAIFSKGGFDIVIGNPPYIQIQTLSSDIEKDILSKAGFQTFQKTADIYCLFYEKGVQVLTKGGILGFITSNKWMRAGYGEKLRDYFSKNTNPIKLIDFAGFKVFDQASVDTNILVLSKSDNAKNAESITINCDYTNLTDLELYFEKNKNQSTFNTSSVWIVTSDIEDNIIEKIIAHGKPLGKLKVQINLGIKTGLNEAFIISETIKNDLIRKEPDLIKIIKPLLRGRDIKRYQIKYSNLWIINSHNGYIKKDEVISRINVEKDFPLLKEYLNTWHTRLKTRKDKGDTLYNLRDCKYLDDFNQEKIIWSDMASKPSFFLDNGEYYINNTAYFLKSPNNSLYYGILNSNYTFFYFNKIASGLGNKGKRYFKNFVEQIIIPDLTIEQENIIINNALNIHNNPHSPKTNQFDKIINHQIYEAFQFTPEEIEIVEKGI